jgi:hypothetical protein
VSTLARLLTEIAQGDAMIIETGEDISVSASFERDLLD